MKAYSYDQVKDTISIEPGALWGEIYDGLQFQGVAPVGGRETSVLDFSSYINFSHFHRDVGASGLLLGGGLSYLSSAYGFSCDTYVSLDVVLPSGQLVTATATNQYSDLFRALKGGGSRFGIVTKFEVTAVHTGTVLDKTWFGGSILVFQILKSSVI